MLFVQRDADGKIQALFKEVQPCALESLPGNHAEIIAFLSEQAAADDPSAFTPATDLQMVRIIEDVIDLLINKKLILLTELPEAVQRKLLNQRHRREHIFGTVSVVGDDEEGIF